MTELLPEVTTESIDTVLRLIEQVSMITVLIVLSRNIPPIPVSSPEQAARATLDRRIRDRNRRFDVFIITGGSYNHPQNKLLITAE
jgi:hypothetical protein